MGTVSADKGDGWVIKDLMRKKFVQKLEGKNIPNPSAFVNSAEGQQLLEEVKKEVEDFLGYTVEEAHKENLNEDMAHEIKRASRSSGDEKMKDGIAELECDEPDSVM